MSEGEAILYQLVEQIPESERGGNKDPMEIIDFAVERQLAKLRGARRRPAKRGMAGAKARKRARVH